MRSGMRALGNVRNALNDVTLPAAGGMRLGELSQRLGAQIRDDHIRAHAGNLAFRGIFSLFSALVVTFALLALFQARDLVEILLQQLPSAIHPPVINALRGQILATTLPSAQSVISIGTAASTLAALYGLSATARAVIDAMNAMYEVEEQRPFLSRYVTSLVMGLAVIGLLMLALLLVVIGPRVGRTVAALMGLENAFEFLWTFARWPLLVTFVLLGYALVYTFAPAANVPFRFVTHGSITAFFGWLAFSLGFSFYVEKFGSFNATYGTVAGVAVLLLYMYFSSLMMLIGAEINDIIDRRLQSGASATDVAR